MTNAMPSGTLRMNRVKPGLSPTSTSASACSATRDHVAGALLEPAHLVRRVADGPAHLPGELRRDLVPPGDEGIDRRAQDDRALGDRNLAPGLLRSRGALERGRDLRLGCQRPLDVDLTVDRRDHPDPVAHRAPARSFAADDRMRAWR